MINPLWIEKTEDKDFCKKCLENLPFSLAIIRSQECKMFDMFEYRKPILDIGCGDGLFSKFLFKDKLDFGLDITKKALIRAKEKETYRLNIMSDASILPFMEESFNSVISNCVVEHVLDPDSMFREVNRVLKPDGSFFFTTHTHQYNDYLFYSNLFCKLGLQKLGKRYEKFINEVFKHVNCLRPEVWEKKLGDAGLKLDSLSYYFTPKAQKLFDFLVPFTFLRFILWRNTGRWFILDKNHLSFLFYKIVKDLYDEEPVSSSAIVIKAVKRR
jgi:2-polyprenyl-3-methyl-5-hydroxy-6-metoxy-1,4-benzoquinol methylase